MYFLKGMVKGSGWTSVRYQKPVRQVPVPLLQVPLRSWARLRQPQGPPVRQQSRWLVCPQTLPVPRVPCYRP